MTWVLGQFSLNNLKRNCRPKCVQLKFNVLNMSVHKYILSYDYPLKKTTIVIVVIQKKLFREIGAGN